MNPANVPVNSACQLVQPKTRPMLAAILASFLNYESRPTVRADRGSSLAVARRRNSKRHRNAARK
jgi:hypothetical protein